VKKTKCKTCLETVYIDSFNQILDRKKDWFLPYYKNHECKGKPIVRYKVKDRQYYIEFTKNDFGSRVNSYETMRDVVSDKYDLKEVKEDG